MTQQPMPNLSCWRCGCSLAGLELREDSTVVCAKCSLPQPLQDHSPPLRASRRGYWAVVVTSLIVTAAWPALASGGVPTAKVSLPIKIASTMLIAIAAGYWLGPRRPDRAIDWDRLGLVFLFTLLLNAVFWIALIALVVLVAKGIRIF